MFIDEKTGVKIYADLNDTVIRATLRTFDLYTAFIEVLKDTAEYLQIVNQVPAYALEDDQNEYWDSEDISYLVNEDLFNVLNSYAPEGYYFGSTEGDGSDFGYWQIIL